MKVETESRGDYLEAMVSGSYDLREAVRLFGHLLELARRAGATRILINCEQLQTPDSSAVQNAYATGAFEHYRDHLMEGGSVLRIAFLATHEAEKVYGAWLARLESRPFRLFTERDEAVSWLGSE